MKSPAVTLNIQDGIAWLTLARPEKRNSVDPEFAVRVHELAEQCAAERAICCVVLTASGKYFCVGGDIAACSAVGLTPDGGASPPRKCCTPLRTELTRTADLLL